MKIEKDYNEFLKLLNKYKIRYCIIGSYAVGFLVCQDILKILTYLLTQQRKILKVFDKFGFGNLGITKDDLTKVGNI